MAVRGLVLVVAIAFSPSCCAASNDEDHDYGMAEGGTLVLLQTAMQKRGTQAKAKQANPGRDVLASDSDATWTMMGDGDCTESWTSFADISIEFPSSSMNAPADAYASMGADDIATDSESTPSSSISLYIGRVLATLIFLVLLDMLRLWYVDKSGDDCEDDGVSLAQIAHGDAVDDTEEAQLTVVEIFFKHCVEVDERDVHGETPLHTAARAGANDVCKLLLDQGAAINASNVIGQTPLGVAALAGKQATCDLLLGRGASAGAASYEDVCPPLERYILEQVEYQHTACGDSADVPADPAPAREGALQSLIALMSELEADKAETLIATEDFPDDSAFGG